MNALKEYQKKCQAKVSEVLAGKKHVIRHIRTWGGRIVATLLAVVEEVAGAPEGVKVISIGWSKCNKHDTFNRSVGILKAYKRRLVIDLAEHISTRLDSGYWWTQWGEEEGQIPQAVRKHLAEFVGRVRERAEKQGGE